jgi:hypothetical protein
VGDVAEPDDADVLRDPAPPFVEGPQQTERRLRYRTEALDWYSDFLNLGMRAGVLPAAAPLDAYDLVVPAALADRDGDRWRRQPGRPILATGRTSRPGRSVSSCC